MLTLLPANSLLLQGNKKSEAELTNDTPLCTGTSF